MTLFSTTTPVIANNTVIATDVDSRTFHCSDNPENRSFFIGLRSDTAGGLPPAGTRDRICSGGAYSHTRFRKSPVVHRAIHRPSHSRYAPGKPGSAGVRARDKRAGGIPQVE